jgi:pyrroline-5-carboxylate reductase
MTESKLKLSILGTGNLGAAIAKGVVKKGLVTSSSVILTRRHLEPIQSMEREGYVISQDNLMATKHADVIILCVQPKQLPELTKEILPALSGDKVLVSTITGVSLSELEVLISGKVPVVRAMPNTAAAIGESITCLSTNKGKEHLPEIERIFGSLGTTLVIDDEMMQAATVLGASGIAFFMRYVRAATQGGIQMGFHPEEAQKIVVQTARGAAGLIQQQGSHPELEIDKVTTPRGCTIEGLNEMEHQGFSSALIKGLMTSFEKIKLIK